MKMVKIILKYVLPLVIVVLLYKGCQYKRSNKCLDAINEKLVANIKDEAEIDFENELECLEWDSLMLIDRHFDAGDVKSKTGVDLSDFRLMGFKSIYKSDFYTFIAILNKRKIVAVIETSGGVYIDEFITELDNNDMAIIAKEDAKFITYFMNEEYLDGTKIYSITFKDKKLIEKYKRVNK